MTGDPSSEPAPLFVFLVLHYPAPENTEQLLRGMNDMRAGLQSLPGCLGVDPPLLTADGTCLVGYSRWESEEAFWATGITLGSADEVIEGELRPRQRLLLKAQPAAPPLRRRAGTCRRRSIRRTSGTADDARTRRGWHRNLALVHEEVLHLYLRRPWLGGLTGEVAPALTASEPPASPPLPLPPTLPARCPR